MSQSPDERIDKTDQGPTAMAMYVKNGHLILNFGKNLSWIGLSRKEVEALIEVLRRYLDNPSL